MVFQRIGFKVEDFDKFKGVFTGRGSVRKSHGSHGSKVYIDPGNNKSVVIVLEWADADKMKAFGESDDQKEAMKSAGVAGPPEFKVADNEAELDVSGLTLSFSTET